MSTKERTRRGTTLPVRRPFPVAPAVAAAVVAVLVIGAWFLLRPTLRGENSSAAGGLPGPIGGSSVAMDVNTMVGKPAPAFTLSDSEGQSYAITPGQGRPIVFISHMGIT